MGETVTLIAYKGKPQHSVFRLDGVHRLLLRSNYGLNVQAENPGKTRAKIGIR